MTIGFKEDNMSDIYTLALCEYKKDYSDLTDNEKEKIQLAYCKDYICPSESRSYRVFRR